MSCLNTCIRDQGCQGRGCNSFDNDNEMFPETIVSINCVKNNRRKNHVCYP